MNVTPEECYAYWHKQYHKYEGKIVRGVKNFNKVHQRAYWCYFEQFANLVNRNAGHLNYKLFITALADQYEGYYHPSVLMKRRSIRIYNSYIKEIEFKSTDEDIKNQLVLSLRYIIDFCKERKITKFDDYLFHDRKMIPSILKHLCAGSVSPYFLACIPSFDEVIQSYPQDMIDEYLSEFKTNYGVYRLRLVNSEHNMVKKFVNKNVDLFTVFLNK